MTVGALNGIRSGSVRFHPLCELVQKTRFLGGKRYVSMHAARTLEKHPEILVASQVHLAGFSSVQRRTAEFSSGDGKVRIFHKPDGKPYDDFDIPGTYYYSPEDGIAYNRPDETIESAPYPQARDILAVAELVYKAGGALHSPDVGVRDREDNHPTYIASPALLYYHWLNALSRKYDFGALDGLDMGSGLGMAVFISSHYFRTFTGVENHEPLHAASIGLRGILMGQGHIKDNVSFVLADFLNRRFSLSGYRFIYLYLPILKNSWLLAERLHDAESGTLILAYIVDEMGKDTQFKMLESFQMGVERLATVLYVKK